MSTEAEKIKALARALRTVTALDARKATAGTLNEAQAVALKEAETFLAIHSGRVITAAFRQYNSSGVTSVDPTGSTVAFAARGRPEDEHRRGQLGARFG